MKDMEMKETIVVSTTEETSSAYLTNLARKNPGGVYFMGIQTNNEIEELKRIELAARTCYKSEDKITEESARKMFLNLIKRGHFAMLRFGERTVAVSDGCWKRMKEFLAETEQLQFWRWKRIYVLNGQENQVYITSNLNSWINFAKLVGIICKVNKDYLPFKNLLLDVFPLETWPILHNIIKKFITTCGGPNRSFLETYTCRDVDIKEEITLQLNGLKRFCFRVVTDRGITHEIVRHTTLSYAQESTRWIKYNGTEKTPVEEFVWKPEHLAKHEAINDFYSTFLDGFTKYEYWTSPERGENKLVPGDARNFLPHCMKTEICISGYLDYSLYGEEFNKGFSHFIDMRNAPDAHKGIQPIAREIERYIAHEISGDPYVPEQEDDWRTR